MSFRPLMIIALLSLATPAFAAPSDGTCQPVSTDPMAALGQDLGSIFDKVKTGVEDTVGPQGSGAFLEFGAKGLTGNFSSSKCEALPDGTFELRSYSFGAKAASASWDRYGDAQCSAGAKLMSIVINGTAKVDGLSKTIPGAANITVSMSQKTVTPTAAGLAVLQKECGGYSWQAGTSESVTTGCGALFQQTDDCAAEYDLMKLTSKGLVFGNRSQPLCSEATRPTSLSPFAVVPGPGYQDPAQ